MEYFIVNSFTNEPFKGNPAGILIVKEFPKQDIMQNIAKQLNLVETVFIKVIENNRFIFKYFTPYKELPLAGHPTIAGLKVLKELGYITQNIIKIVTADKVLDAFSNTYNNSDVFSLKIEQIEHKKFITNKQLVASTLGVSQDDLIEEIPVKIVDSGLGHIIVPLKTLQALNKVKRNIKELKRLCTEFGAREVQAFTFETLFSKNQLHTRNICPREGIEDPACGVGNAALLSYLADIDYEHQQVNIEQGYINNFHSIIKGTIINKECVLVGGNAIIMSKGIIFC